MADEAAAAEVAKFRAERRAALRHEYWKQVTSPYRHGSGEGGHVFDPAVQRYLSTRSSGYDYFKPSPRSGLMVLGIILLPMFGYGWMIHKERSEKEHKFRTGQVAYKDRLFKFI